MFTKYIRSLIALLEKIEVEFKERGFDSDLYDKLESEVYQIEAKLNEIPYLENQVLLKKAGEIISRIKKDNGFENLELL